MAGAASNLKGKEFRLPADKMKKKKVIGFVSKYFLTVHILSFTCELDMKRFPTIGESFVHFLFIK